MTHPSEGKWALDAYHLGRVGFHIGLADSRALHAAEAIWGCEPTEPYSQRRIDCEFCCATETRLNSDLLLPGADP